jgi:Uma2 family endonuclease
VISPSERASDSHDKVLAYLRSGAGEVWQVYPKSRTVRIHRGEASRSLAWSQPVETDLTPGFELRLGSLFA